MPNHAGSSCHVPSFEPITVAEAARILEMTRRGVTRAIEAGHLPSQKLPGKTGAYLLRIEDVRAFKQFRDEKKTA